MLMIGIDIAKEKFDVALFQGKELLATRKFANHEAGFQQLSRRLTRQSADQVWACLEATGRYGDALAVYLHEAGRQVSLVNPAHIKKYAASQL